MSNEGRLVDVMLLLFGELVELAIFRGSNKSCSPSLTMDSFSSQLVSITNHTFGTVRCVWMTSSSDAFRIIPDEREIPAGKTGSFAINFRPVSNSTLMVWCYSNGILKSNIL